MFFASPLRTATARTTWHVSDKLLAMKGRMAGSSTNETTTFAMPLAVSDLVMATVMSSAPTVVASAIPTNLDDDGTDRYSMGFDSEGVAWTAATIKKDMYLRTALQRSDMKVEKSGLADL